MAKIRLSGWMLPGVAFLEQTVASSDSSEGLGAMGIFSAQGSFVGAFSGVLTTLTGLVP